MKTGQLALRLGTESARERDPEWFDIASSWIAQLIPGTRFTSDELRQAIGSPHGSGNIVGAFFRHAKQQGWIYADGARQSKRPEARGRWVAVWRV